MPVFVELSDELSTVTYHVNRECIVSLSEQDAENTIVALANNTNLLVADSLANVQSVINA